MEITLDLLLRSRDERRCRQQQLLQTHPELTLLCLTVIMPGAVKRNNLSLTVAQVACQAVDETFCQDLVYQERRDLVTGYEAYWLSPLDAVTCKRRACDIEDHHPLGRLFDIDVLTVSGVPLSRTALGYSPRRCLLCQQEARYCMRNATHTQQELHDRIVQLVNEWRQKHQ